MLQPTIDMGLIYPFDKDKFEKEISEKRDVSIGFYPDSLYDYINAMEVIANYNHTEVIHKLKTDLMLCLGKIQETKEEQNGTS